MASIGRSSSIFIIRWQISLWEFRCCSTSSWATPRPVFFPSHGNWAKNSASWPQPSARFAAARSCKVCRRALLVQNLPVSLLCCKILRTGITRLYRSGGRVCVSEPVSEGLHLSRPRGIGPERVPGLGYSVYGCNQFQRVPLHGRGAVHGVCDRICLALLVLPGVILGRCLWYLAVVAVLLQFHGPVPVWSVSLCPLPLSEGRADKPIFLPGRLVSCMLSWGYQRFFRPAVWVLHHRVGNCLEELLLSRVLFRYKGHAGLHVSLPRGLVSCRVWQGHGNVM